MVLLFSLYRQHVPSSVRLTSFLQPHVIAAIGDIALAIGKGFVKYSEEVYRLLSSACTHAIDLVGVFDCV